MLPWFTRRPTTAIGVLLVSFAGTFLLLRTLGQEFLPNFQETDFLMHFVEKPGTSIEAMDRITILASKELRSIPGVRNFGSHIGRAEVADEVVGPNFTELWISIDESVDYKETLGKVEAAVDGYPGLYRDVLTYLRERVKEVLTGASSSIVVRIYGPDLAGLRRQAQQVAAVMEKIEGVSNLKVESQVARASSGRSTQTGSGRAVRTHSRPGPSSRHHSSAGLEGGRNLRETNESGRRGLGDGRVSQQSGRAA